jgi:BirA family biotin operon repressor/biotin-[acetyl-CoA-carboxylase] ligase
MDDAERATRRRVLDALAAGPVRGPELADRLDVSRAAVWKHVEALRDEGFEVTSGDDGYRVESVPEYGAAAIEFGLDADFEVEFHESLGSTNVRARELATEGASDIAVVADRQTGARGRLGRAWSAPPGGIYVSIVTRPDLPPARVPVYTLAAAVATTRAARELGVDAGIKWPNDVLVGPDERKLAGILTEMEGEADRISWIVVGIGINANVDREALPETATSLQEAVGGVDRGAFLRQLLATFDDLRDDPESVLPAWREHALTLGKRVRVETPGGVVEGEAVDVEFPGTLLVKTDEGTVSVSAGDCEHLRPLG